jgi:hypothetical protein
VVNRLWDQFPVRHVIASQFIRDDLPALASMFTKQTFKEALCGLCISPLLQGYINYFTVLVNGSP